MVSSQELELLSRQISQAHRAAIQVELAVAGLSEVGHPLLLCILENTASDACAAPCHAQRDLAQLLHISPAAVATSLKSLEKGGYVRREPDTEDSRRNTVTLTEKGAQAVQGCHHAFERVNSRMLTGFTDTEKQLLLAFRHRMLHNLRGIDPAKKEEP